MRAQVTGSQPRSIDTIRTSLLHWLLRLVLIYAESVCDGMDGRLRGVRSGAGASTISSKPLGTEPLVKSDDKTQRAQKLTDLVD